MLKSPPENRNIIRLRTPALFGIFVLALFQLSFASHQLQHPADHGISVCELCTAYNELDDVPLAATPAIAMPTQLAGAVTTPLHSLVPVAAGTSYQSRAPPLS